jgi:hypothetical protein
MPARMRKLPNGKYRVYTPNGVHARATTRAKAKRQVSLLNALDHGFKPDKK